jgi:hypothetical protein
LAQLSRLVLFFGQKSNRLGWHSAEQQNAKRPFFLQPTISSKQVTMAKSNKKAASPRAASASGGPAARKNTPTKAKKTATKAKKTPTKASKGGQGRKGDAARSAKGTKADSPKKTPKSASYKSRQKSPATTATTTKSGSPASASTMSSKSRGSKGKKRRSKTSRRLVDQMMNAGLDEAKDEANDDSKMLEDSTADADASQDSASTKPSPKKAKTTHNNAKAPFVSEDNKKKYESIMSVLLEKPESIVAHLAANQETNVKKMMALDLVDLLDILLNSKQATPQNMKILAGIYLGRLGRSDPTIGSMTGKKIQTYLTNLILDNYDALKPVPSEIELTTSDETKSGKMM